MRALLIICALFIPAPALALVQVSSINDFSLGNWALGDGAVNANMDMCLYAIATFPAGSYAVTVSSPGGYKLTSGMNQINYTLAWEDAGAGGLGGGAGTPLANGVKLTGRANASILSPLCALGLAGPTARLKLSISEAEMTAALAGSYSGTITILISPN